MIVLFKKIVLCKKKNVLMGKGRWSIPALIIQYNINANRNRYSTICKNDDLAGFSGNFKPQDRFAFPAFCLLGNQNYTMFSRTKSTQSIKNKKKMFPQMKLMAMAACVLKFSDVAVVMAESLHI